MQCLQTRQIISDQTNHALPDFWISLKVKMGLFSLQESAVESDAQAPAERLPSEEPLDDYLGSATPLPSPSVVGAGTGGDESDGSDLASTSSDSSQECSPSGGNAVTADVIKGPVGETVKAMWCTNAVIGATRPFVDVWFQSQTLKC